MLDPVFLFSEIKLEHIVRIRTGPTQGFMPLTHQIVSSDLSGLAIFITIDTAIKTGLPVNQYVMETHSENKEHKQ